MKKQLKNSILAFALAAGGTIGASAASSIETFNGYQVNLNWGNPTNNTLGTTTAIIWDINGGPSTADNVFPLITSQFNVNTDGSGKIIGAGFIRVDYDFASNNPPVTFLQVDVSGKVSQSGSSPTKVSLTLKGTGATDRDSGTTTTRTNFTAASCNLTFTGSPATNPDTNTSTTVPQIIAGTLNGTITGWTPVNDKSTKINKVTAQLDPSGATRNFLDLNGEVIANGKNAQFFGNANGGDVQGKGTIKTGTYKLSLKGIGQAKGASLSINGNLTTSTTNNIIIGTNPPVQVIISTPGTATVKGKGQGQSVSGDAQKVTVF